MNLRNLIIKLWNSPTITTWMSFLTKSFSVTVILPLVLNRLNVNDVNLWYMFTGVLSLQIILDAGFGSAFVRIIAYGTVGMRDFSILKNAKESNDTDNSFDQEFVTTAYSLMENIYKRLFWVSLFFTYTVGSYIFIRAIQMSTYPAFGWITWSLFATSFSIVVWGNMYVNFLQGTHNIPLLRRWDTLFNLLNSLFCIIVLLLTPNVYLLIIINQIWLLIGVGRNYFLVHKKYPFLKGYKIDIELKADIRKNLMPSAIKSGVGILMSQGIIQASGFIYAQLASPTALASYLLGLNLIQAIRNFSQAPFYSRLPELATCTGRGNINKLMSIAQKNMFRVYLIYSILFFGVAFFHEPIFNLIGSKVKFPDPELWGLLGIAFLVDRYGAMHLQVYSTTNHIIWHSLNGITGVLMIALSVILYPILSINAFPISMLCSYILFYSWYAPYKSYRFMNVNFFKFEKYSFIPCVLLFIFNLILHK